MNEKDQVINFLFQACDSKTNIIAGLQKQLSDQTTQIEELKKRLAESDIILNASAKVVEVKTNILPSPSVKKEISDSNVN